MSMKASRKRRREESDSKDEFEDILAKMKRVASRVPLPQVEYKDFGVPDIVGPGSRQNYILRFLEDSREIRYLGRQVFSELRGTITNQTIANLFLLAYNLRGPEKERYFGRVHPDLLSARGIDSTEIKVIKLERFVNATKIREAVDDDVRDKGFVLANGYCYLAASFLRLYAKSADSYKNVGEQLKNGYYTFYKKKLPFKDHHPEGEIIEAIKAHLDVDEILKNTLYNLLYAGSSVSDGKELKDFLYGNHLENTGLHSLDLFLKCMSAYNIGYDQMLSLINGTAFGYRIVKQGLMIVRTFYCNPGNEYKLGMWKYARIFDQRFMSQLQTANCMSFVYTLACLYHKKVGKTATRDATKIAKLSIMTKDSKRDCEKAAQMMYDKIGK